MYILKYLFSIWDDYFENLGVTTALVCEMFPSSFRPWLKNVACFSSLISDVINRRRTISRSYLTNGRLFYASSVRIIKNIKCSRHRRVGGWYARKTNTYRCFSFFFRSSMRRGYIAIDDICICVTIYPLHHVSYFWIGSADLQFSFPFLLSFCSVLEISERLYVKVKTKTMHYLNFNVSLRRRRGDSQDSYAHWDVSVRSIFKQIFSRPLSCWTSHLIWISGKPTTSLKTKIIFELLVLGR